MQQILSQNFLRDLLSEAHKAQEVTEDKLIEYTDTMLQVFDSNKDGKLQLSEMAKWVIWLCIVYKREINNVHYKCSDSNTIKLSAFLVQATPCEREFSNTAGFQGNSCKVKIFETQKSIKMQGSKNLTKEDIAGVFSLYDRVSIYNKIVWILCWEIQLMWSEKII